MAILIVTNRRLQQGKKGAELFGEDVNIKGPGELRLAWAKKTKGKWELELVKEPKTVTEDNRPSRLVYRDLRKRLIENQRDCVFYIHGFNKSFEESLDQCRDIERLYKVDVVGFSWPSNPGGIINIEYKKAQGIAAASNIALDRTFNLLGRYVCETAIADEDCPVSLNLLVHSLGNYLFQKFISSPVFSSETKIFDNIILHQADVDNPGHDQWVNMLRYAAFIYVTINERDRILAVSDVINKDRLGNTARNLIAGRSKYVDFTGADEVGKGHQLWTKARKNPDIKAFFDKSFHGLRAVDHLAYDPGSNSYS